MEEAIQYDADGKKVSKERKHQLLKDIDQRSPRLPQLRQSMTAPAKQDKRMMLSSPDVISGALTGSTTRSIPLCPQQSVSGRRSQ